MSAAATIIAALISAVASGVSSYSQSQDVDKAQKEAKKLNEQSQKLERENLNLARRSQAEQERQFDETMAFSREKESHSRLGDQFKSFNEILDRNEALSDLVINRFGKLRK